MNGYNAALEIISISPSDGVARLSAAFCSWNSCCSVFLCHCCFGGWLIIYRIYVYKPPYIYILRSRVCIICIVEPRNTDETSLFSDQSNTTISTSFVLVRSPLHPSVCGWVFSVAIVTGKCTFLFFTAVWPVWYHIDHRSKQAVQ